MKRLPEHCRFGRLVGGRCLRLRLFHAAVALVAQICLVGPWSATAKAQTTDAPTTAAAVNAGMSPVRLQRLNQVLDAAVLNGDLKGAVLSVNRNGREVFTSAFGHLDAARQQAMPVDAVFDLSTLTQPVTIAAAISWQEQGGWLLTDPVGQYLAPLERRQASLWDVMRQTDGLASAIDPLDREAGGRIKPSERWSHSLDAALRMTGDSFIHQVARQAQTHPSGGVARPGFSLDLLGLALEQSSQETLGTFFLRHLFIPLDMWDTGFNPPAGLENRLVTHHGKASGVTGGSPVRDPRDPVIFECGGACLTGTASDYLRFAQMLLNGGRIGEQQVLSRLSVDMMTRHQLASGTENRLPTLVSTNELHMAEHRSGLGLALVPEGVPMPLPVKAGDFGAWSPSGSFFWVSPSEQLAVVMLAVSASESDSVRLRQQVIALVARAIVD